MVLLGAVRGSRLAVNGKKKISKVRREKSRKECC